MEEEQEKLIRDELRNSLVIAINNNYEFYFLEELCDGCDIAFNENVYNPCLDRYITLRKEGEDQFKSKYAALFLTSWKLLTGLD